MYVADNPQLIPAATTAGFTFIGSGTMLGPPLAGFLFDRSGEYYLSFGCAAGMMVLGAATMCLPLRCFGGDGAGPAAAPLREPVAAGGKPVGVGAVPGSTSGGNVAPGQQLGPETQLEPEPPGLAQATGRP